MRPLASTHLLLRFFSAGVFGLTGCTIIGHVIGSSIDKARPDMEKIPEQEVRDIEPSTHVRTIKKDSTRIEGDIIRLDIMPPETASAWYAGQGDSRHTDSLFPGFGQSITLKVNPQDGGPTCWGTFYGVDTWNLYWRDRVSARIIQTPFDRVIQLVHGDNNVVAGSDIPELVRRVGMPNIAAIWLHSGALIPLRDVAWVEVKATKDAHMTWTLVGVAVDCAVLVAGAIAMSQFFNSGLGGWGH